MKTEDYNVSKISDELNVKDENKNGFIGEVIDTFIDPKTGERIPVQHGFNLVVNSCSVLIASLLKGQGQGITYLAVGTGLPSWTDENIPSPLASDTTLTTELYRKAIVADNIKFVDDANNISLTPTNRLQITVIFTETEANGSLKELGFFGGTATITKNSGYMVNKKIHSPIPKTEAMQLERVIRFTF